MDKNLGEKWPGAWQGQSPPPIGTDIKSLDVKLPPPRRALPATLFLANGFLLLALCVWFFSVVNEGFSRTAVIIIIILTGPFFTSSVLISGGFYRLAAAICIPLLVLGLLLRHFIWFFADLLFPALPGASIAWAEHRWETLRIEIANRERGINPYPT